MLLTSLILALRSGLVTKLVILGISPLTSFILASRAALVAMLVIPGILSSVFLILALYSFFLTTSFLTRSPSLLKSVGTSFNLSVYNFKLAKSPC